MLMQLVPEDQAKGLKTPVWEEYKSIVNQVLHLTWPPPAWQREIMWLINETSLLSFNLVLFLSCVHA